MRKKMRNGFALLLAALAVLALLGCPTDAGSLSSDASVSSVTVAGVPAITVGTPNMDWALAVENRGHIYITGTSLENAQVKVSATAGSTVFLAKAKADIVPEFVTEKTFDFEAEDFLFVEVFSENLDKYLIYAIQIHNRTPGMTDFTLSGRSAVGGVSASGRPIQAFGTLGESATALEAITAGMEGTIVFAEDAEGTALPLTITPEAASYSARAAIASTGTPVFSGAWVGAGDNGVISGINITPKDGSYLYIQLKGEGGAFSDITYYKIKLAAKNADRALKSVVFEWYEGDTLKGSQNMAIGTMGTASFAGNESFGNYTGGISVPAGDGIYTITDYTTGATSIPANYKLKVKAVGRDANLGIKFDTTKNYRDGGLTFPIENAAAGADLGRLVGTWVIGLEVTSGLGEKGWYAFELRAGRTSTALDDIKINGVSIKAQNSDALPAANTDVTGTTAGVYRFATKAGLDTVKIEAVPPAGLVNSLSYSIGATLGTSVSNTAFVANNENKVDTFGSFVSGQYIFIQVVSEAATLSWGGSGGPSVWTSSVTGVPAVSYYKVQILYGESDAGVTGITINGESVGADFSAAGPFAAPTVTTKMDKTVTADKLATFKIQATPTAGKNAQISYAVTASVAATPAEADYNTTGEFPNLPSNRYVIVRARSEDGSVTNYYKFYILNGGSSSFAVDKFKVNGTDVIPADANTLTSTTDTKGNVTNSMGTASVDASVSSLNTVIVVPDGFAEGTAFAYVVSESNAATTAPTDDTYQTSGEFTNFPVASWVFIRVTTADNTAIRYYKIRIMLSGANTTAGITEVKIAGAAVTPLPTANTALNGTNITNYLVPGSSVAVLNNLEVSVKADNGASVAYGVGATASEATMSWSTEAKFPTWQNATYLYIRVISQDGLTTQYYKVRISWGDSGATLTDIKFNGKSITTEGGVPAPNANVNTGTTAGLFHPDDLSSIAVEVAAPATASVMYAIMGTVVPSSTSDFKGNITYGTIPWTNESTFKKVTVGAYLYIRVVSQDTSVTNTYKVQLAQGNNATALAGITVNNVSIGALPAANAAATGTTAATYTIASQLATVTVAATQAAGQGATITYATAANASTAPAAAAFTATNSFPGFVSAQYVVIRAVSQDGVNTVYYKVRVIHGNAEAELEGIRINGNYVIPVPTANTAVTGTTAGTLQVTAADLASLTVKVGVSPGASVAYAAEVANNTNTTTWTNTTGVFPKFTAGQYVVVRVISQDGQTTRYYKVQVTVAP